MLIVIDLRLFAPPNYLGFILKYVWIETESSELEVERSLDLHVPLNQLFQFLLSIQLLPHASDIGTPALLRTKERRELEGL